MKKALLISIAAAILAGCPQQQQTQPQAQNQPPIQKPVAAPDRSADMAPATLPADKPKVSSEPLPPIPPSSQSADTQGKRTYTVEKGETFFSISRKLYGNDSRAKEIQAMNPGVDPKKLKVGQVINVPK